MPTLISWLLAAIGPLVRKALLTLGIGALSYAGVQGIINQLFSAVQLSWGAVGGVTQNVLTMAGVPEAVGIILGAYSAKASFIVLSKFGRVVS